MANAVGVGAGVPTQWQQSLDSAMSTVRMQVTPENVLEVMEVLLAEAARLRKSTARARNADEWVGHCGGDPVSVDASDQFNNRISLLVEQCRQYAEQLWRAGRSLEEVARSYGHAESEILASLQRVDRRSQV